MAWLVLSAIFVIVGGIGLMIGIAGRQKEDASGAVVRPENERALLGGFLTAGLCLTGFVILTFVSSINLVGQRQVGIIKSFSGTIADHPTGHGTVFVAPWTSVIREDIGIQREDFLLDAANAAVSQDVQPIYANLSLNYQVEPEDVVGLYKKVGPNWKHVLLDSRVLQDFKEVTSQYTAAEITTKREQLRQDTKLRLTQELQPYSIKVVDFFVKNLDYSAEYKQAVSDKNVQQQKSLQAQAKVAQARAEAEQEVATAQGDARATLVRATAEAQALARKGRAIRQNPEVLNLEAIDKLNPNAEVIICTGSGQGNCPSFLPQPVTRSGG
jgi:prohibitin 2